MRTSRVVAVVLTCLAWLLAACGSEDPQGEDGQNKLGDGVEEALELPTEPAFAPGPRRFPVASEDRIWSAGSVIHLGDDTYDLAPAVVDGFLPTPYGIFVRVIEGEGIDATTEVRYFNGEGALQELPHGVNDVAVSESGEYVGWLFRGGPEVESHAEGARASVAVLAEAATGEVIHQSVAALLEGADYPDEYSPKAHGFLGETFYWGDAYAGEVAGVNAETLEEETSTESEIDAAFAAPERGAYDVAAHYKEIEYGAVLITDSHGRKVDIGYDWALPLGTVGDPGSDRVLLLGQHVDPGELLDDAAPQDGAIVECALGSGDCTEVAKVSRADEVRGAARILW